MGAEADDGRRNFIAYHFQNSGTPSTGLEVVVDTDNRGNSIVEIDNDRVVAIL